MKRAELGLNMAISLEMNILRINRWINQRLSKVQPRRRIGRMAWRANARRMETNALFPFNPYRHPRRARR